MLSPSMEGYSAQITHKAEPARLEIKKYVEGVSSILALRELTPTGVDMVRIECEGNTIRALVNGVLQLSATEPGPTFESGPPGIYI